MKRILMTLTLIGGLCITTTQPAIAMSHIPPVDTSLSQETDADEATIDQVIQVIQEALVEAQTNNVPGFPRLKSATVSLNTVTNRKTSAGFNFLVFSIGTKFETETASSLQLVLAPPKTTDTAGPQSVNPAVLKNALSRAINLAKAAVVLIKDGKDGKAQLVMNTIKLELKFTVKVEGSGGAKIVLLPIGIEGTSNLARTKIHTIALEFGGS
jgi:hypothetical protein